MQDDIFKLYGQDVFKYLLALTKNTDIAEELTQETFYQAIKSINRYDGSCKITTWLFAIAKNVYHNYVRKEIKKNGNVSLDDITLTFYDDNSQVQNIYKEIHNLGEPYNEIILLRVFSDMNFKQIGEVFNKSESWARVTFHRAKLRLKERLDNND